MTGFHERGSLMVRKLLPLLVILSAGVAVRAAEEAAKRLPSVQEMAASRFDIWGEASLRQLGGPSYEFFKDLLPPLRYVNTAFRYYPIVLSAPKERVMARGTPRDTCPSCAPPTSKAKRHSSRKRLPRCAARWRSMERSTCASRFVA